MAEQQVQKSLDLTIKLATRLYCIVWPRRKLWYECSVASRRIQLSSYRVEKKSEPNKEVGQKRRKRRQRERKSWNEKYMVTVVWGGESDGGVRWGSG